MSDEPALPPCAEPAQLKWQACQLRLQATSSPRRAHPLSVFEALVKGAKESAGTTAPLLWNWPGQHAEVMSYQPEQLIALELQLFTQDTTVAVQLQAALQERFSGVDGTSKHFILHELTPWQTAQLQLPAQALGWRLAFTTPLPLPKKGRANRTAVSAEEFWFACRKRINKLWGMEPCLPAMPTITLTAWHYWRTTHLSRSQQGEPLFLNGCLGQMELSGTTVAEWLPWLALFAQVGLGDRLAFSLGRFNLLPVFSTQNLAIAPLAATEAVPVRRPLYIDRAGYKLSIANDNLVLEGKKSEIDHHPRHYPLRLLESVQCAQPVELTSSLCHALNQYHIPLILGQPGAEPLVMVQGNNEYQYHQHLASHHRAHAALSPAELTRIAAGWVQAKLAAQAVLIRSRYQAGDNQLLHEIDQACIALPTCASVAAVRGWEGLLARQYYPWLAAQHPTLGAWKGRIRQADTPDPLNALLNYAYTLLRSRVELAVRGQALDPYLGTLHQANGRHTALVSDFMEPFRAWVECLVLRLLGLGQIRIEDMEESAHGICLSTAVRRLLIQSFNQEFHLTNDSRMGEQLTSLVRTYRHSIDQADWTNWPPQL